ncbi:MAG: single-stranded-DNA-specific exonuclease RecJ [Planctomycetota bacterium]
MGDSRRIWRVRPHDEGVIDRLIRGANLPPVVAQLMASRGVADASTAKQFLNSKLTDLRDPSLLPGVSKATQLILDAARQSVPIVVYGDYDADGMTGSAILVNTLRLLGADVAYHVPNRLEDGYGLNQAAIERLAGRGKRMIISVDCGITSVSCATLCRKLGVSLIITDHHTFGTEIPDADAIVHPRLPGTTYPFGELCGAGVAFKLAWSLCQAECGQAKVTPPMRKLLMQCLSLAAIGTVADVVPLVDENRVLVTHGLRTLLERPLPGLWELLKQVGLDKRDRLAAEDIAFTLAPRLNAAGRLGQAQLAVELLTIERAADQAADVEPTSPSSDSSQSDRATMLAEYINGLNGTRETLQRSVQLAANKQARADFDPDGDPALVLAGVNWHAGVIGVVAGKLAEKYAKPVIVISMDNTGRADAVGSGRVGGTGIDLHAALAQCEERLVRFGGHKAAGGITIAENQIEAFRGDFCEAVAQQWADGDLVAELVIDAETTLGQLNLASLSAMETMAPFGAGNPRPVLIARGITLDTPAKTMGKGDRHMSVALRQGNRKIRAVAFGCGDWCDDLNGAAGPIEIAFRPVINDFNGFKSVEAHLIDWRLQSTPNEVRVDEGHSSRPVGSAVERPLKTTQRTE